MQMRRTTRCLTAIAVALLLASCGAENQKTCTTIFGQGVPTSDLLNNRQCPQGQVLVGYGEDIIGGPLVCATVTVTCPESVSGE